MFCRGLHGLLCLLECVSFFTSYLGAFVGIIKTDGLSAVVAGINLYQYHQNQYLP